MSQRTDRKVSSDAKLPSDGKSAKQMNTMQPGVPADSPMGEPNPTKKKSK